MSKLSENFDSTEFACHCCGKVHIDPKLIELLQAIRDKLGKSITIVSGFRCEEHNRKVGGAKHSQHCLGTAADIKVAGMTAHEVYDYLASHFGTRCRGLGKYQNWTHVDVRSGKPARWNG